MTLSKILIRAERERLFKEVVQLLAAFDRRTELYEFARSRISPERQQEWARELADKAMQAKGYTPIDNAEVQP